MADFVTVHEMAPRDGLQNERHPIPTDQKIKLVDLLSECGFARIEVTSFVRADRVPQLADGQEVMHGIRRRAGTAYTVLTPNLTGYGAARRARADAVAIFASASETFSRKNINCSIAESLERFRPVMDAASADDVPVRAYISCITDCPYEGDVDPRAVADLAGTLLQLGCHEISLGDTLGRATPERVQGVLEAVLPHVPARRLAGHFHDTSGRALENIDVSLAMGIRVFDAAAGGLGGCPYAPGASGNVATGAVARMLADRGYQTGIDLARLAQAEAFARSLRSTP